jgi:hypothetical protein
MELVAANILLELRHWALHPLNLMFEYSTTSSTSTVLLSGSRCQKLTTRALVLVVLLLLRLGG